MQGDVQEKRKLTLEAWVGVDWTEVGGGDGELPRQATAGEEEDGNAAAIPGFPSRFLARGGRGRRGEGGGVLRSALSALNRRRRARPPWLGFGFGENREREGGSEKISGRESSARLGGALIPSWWTASSRGAVEGAAASWRGGSSSARAVATEEDGDFARKPLENVSLFTF